MILYIKCICRYYMYMCVYASSIYMQTYIFIYAHVCKCIYIYMYIHIDICMYIYILYIYICTWIYIYIYIHIYIYTQYIYIYVLEPNKKSQDRNVISKVNHVSRDTTPKLLRPQWSVCPSPTTASTTRATKPRRWLKLRVSLTQSDLAVVDLEK